MSMHEDSTHTAVAEHDHHGPGFRTMIKVWAALLVLTVLTVGVTRFDFGFLNKAVALAIATSKALLVIMFFMHLKYENMVFRLMVFTAFVILAIFIGFTFFDTAYR